MKKVWIERVTLHGRHVTKYQFDMYEQPHFDHLKAKVYHWYDMRVPIHVPGWKRFEKLLTKIGAEHRMAGDELMTWVNRQGESRTVEQGPARWRDKVLSWPISQDFRCYEWSVKNRKTIGTVEISAEMYEAWKNK